MTTTIGRYLRIPTAYGGDDLFNPDNPLDGVAQIISSNATHLGRVNSIRGLWERPGADVWADLLIPGVPSSLNWEGDVGDGVAAWYGGRHVITPYGETGRWPNLVVQAHVQAPTGESTSIIVAVMDTLGHPSRAAITDTKTTTSTTPVTLECTVSLNRAGRLRPLAPTPGSPPASPSEQGQTQEFYFWVGFWSSSGTGANKGLVHSVSAYLEAP